MNKKSKKITKRIAAVCGALAIGAVSLSPGAMAVGNIKDSDWKYSLAASGTGLAAKEGREKLDDTSVYMKCTGFRPLQSGSTSGVSFRATAYGGNSATGSFSNIGYNGKISPTYSMYNGKVQYMTNYIHEAGKRYANIYCQPGNGGYLEFSGVWSPDSV